MCRSMMKIICCILTILLLCSCSVIVHTPKPVKPDDWKSSTPVDLLCDGKTNVNEELVARINTMSFTKPKNVILMIGDGMGFNSIAATKAINGAKYEGLMAMECMPVKGQSITYSASDDITDSAAGGTALATGCKTVNGCVGMSDKYDDITSLTEIADSLSMKTGIVSTKAIYDATPAAFSAEARSRQQTKEIAESQLAHCMDGLDVMLGGGRGIYESAEIAPIVEILEDTFGFTYTSDWETAQASNGKLIGLFADGDLNTAKTATPNIMQLTQKTLDLLSDGDEGFFAMIEGAKIDLGSHSNKFDYMADELTYFDEAVSVAMRFVAENPDTVLIVTADHETGGIKYDSEDDYYYYTTTGHTNADVPIFAVGYGTAALSGVHQNTDIAKFIASCFGVHGFGQPQDGEYISLMRQNVLAAIDTLDVSDASVDGVLRESGLFAESVHPDKCLSYKRIDANRLLDRIKAELACPFEHIVTIKRQGETNDYLLKVIVPVGESVSVEGVELEISRAENCWTYTGIVTYGLKYLDGIKLDFFGRYGEYTLYRRFVDAYPLTETLIDLTSPETVDAITVAQPDREIHVENGVMSTIFDRYSRRVTFPVGAICCESDILKLVTGVSVVITNTSDADMPTPTLTFTTGIAAVTSESSVQTIAAGESTEIMYSFGEDLTEDIIDSLSAVKLAIPNRIADGTSYSITISEITAII